jgi:imidazolonepropionase-like amidohydrolase
MILAPIALALLTFAQSEQLTIAADLLHDGNGSIIHNAIVVVEDGRILSVSVGSVPKGALYLDGAVITPGLVDAFSYMGVHAATVEQRSESTPTARLAEVADLDSPAFGRALGEGVTAAFITPDSLNVIGGLGTMVKTWGGQPSDLFAAADTAARVIPGSEALKVSLGRDPSVSNHAPWGQPNDINTRRPTTRMGVTWILRREFHRALAYRQAGGSGDAELDVLVDALEGRITVRVQARRAHDVQTALRFRDEFQIPYLVIEEATEAHIAAELLLDPGVAVALGPAWDIRQRALSTGPSLEELRAATFPPPVCCEHEHLEEDREGTGLYQLSDAGRDLLLLAAGEAVTSAATGMRFGRTGSSGRTTPANPHLLSSAGVIVAFGGAEVHDYPATESSVIHQARLAVRWGMDPAQAIKACTSIAARICGVGDHLGSIEAGKSADLVLWSGDPLAADSNPILVIVDGRVAVDHRSVK